MVTPTKTPQRTWVLTKIRVKDGDTVEADGYIQLRVPQATTQYLRAGYSIRETYSRTFNMDKRSVRLPWLKAPELDEPTKAEGLRFKALLQTNVNLFLSTGQPILLNDYGDERWGRVLGDVRGGPDGTLSLSQLMLAGGCPLYPDYGSPPPVPLVPVTALGRTP